MLKRVTLALIGSAGFALVACGGQQTEEDKEAALRMARADSMALADSLYNPAVYDTLTWETAEARLERGLVVWRTSCQRCHGADGGGEGELVEQLQIDVPSILVAEWPYAGDAPAIRHRIFVGHVGMMPNWGLHGLKYRDIDAAAGYIEELRRKATPSQ